MSDQAPPKPYLSIVVTTRNDNHGGDLKRRTQLFIDGIVVQSARYRLPTELIIVEWNPPPDRPSVVHEFRWPVHHKFLTVRIITVPPEIHRTYRYSRRLPLFQMIAKNVGVRRARGDMILATNVDILFSEALFAHIAARHLDPAKLYRADRYDVDPNIPVEADHDARLNFCDRNVIRINDRFTSRHLTSGEVQRLYPSNIDRLDHFTALFTPLHFNACGDFQMTGRDLWGALRGYAEFEMFSLNIDSCFNVVAHYAGAGEERLPAEMRTYHIEHDSGWKPESGQMGAFFQKMRKRRLKVMSFQTFSYLNKRVTQSERPLQFNRGSWGLGQAILLERDVVIADWDHHVPAPAPSMAALDKGLDKRTSAAFALANFADRVEYHMRRIKGAAVSLWWASRRKSTWGVVIFGADKTGRRILERCAMHSVRVAFFIDNAEDRHGTEIAGLPVFPVEHLAKADLQHIDAVILASEGWKHVMQHQLKELGCRLPVLY